MQKHIAIGVALIFCGLAGSEAAHAQYGPGPAAYASGLPPYEIMRIVRSHGLTPLSRPLRRGPSYMVLALDRGGGRVRLLIDAARGEIVGIDPMLAAGTPGGYARPPAAIPGASGQAELGPSASNGPPPLPGALPRTRVANAPAVTAAPAPTPLPRPRPSLAASEQPAPAATAEPAKQPAAEAPKSEPKSEPKHELHLVPAAPLDE